MIYTLPEDFDMPSGDGKPSKADRFYAAAMEESVKRRQSIAEVRDAVFERDHYYCRVMWCKAHATELAHLKARGMGGSLSRDTTANCVAACAEHHQGRRSLHSGHLKYRFLTDQGADGPMAWEFCEKLPTAECGLSHPSTGSQP